MSLGFNILIIDDDQWVLESVQIMYKNMIKSGMLRVLGDSPGTVSIAKDTREAETILNENFSNDPNLLQILHVDQRMPKETGSEFVNRIRWKFAGRKIGALLVTAYPKDGGVIQSRESGVYKFISKPFTSVQILPFIHDLVEVILSREKPSKKQMDRSFVCKKIDRKEEFLHYSRLRYAVFDFMNYLQQHNDQWLDFDKFDPFSIPFGVFEQVDGYENIQATLRIITPTYQEPYGKMISRLLEEFKPICLEKSIPSLDYFISLERKGPFLVAESIDLSSIINQLERQGVRYAEFSRIIDHPDFRGYGLSRLIIETALTYCILEGIRYIFGGCSVQHLGMYGKYGWKVIPETDLFLEKKVQQVGHVMVMDNTQELTPEINSRIQSHWKPQWLTYGFTKIGPGNNPFLRK